jgi:uncharacterized membrane protein YqjE
MARETSGIVADLKGLASTGVRAVRTRLELIAIELQEEKAWMVRFIVVAVAALYLLTFGLMLAIFAVVVSASPENRAAILGVCAAVFLLAGAGGVAYIYSFSSKRRPMFDETVGVLKGDEQGLRQMPGGSGD